ncbi:MAG: ChbG/HpnK family deacetylase [Pseudolabrys sp.]
MDTPRRHIWLCADDYGISASVNAAVRDLIMRRRINATSVMVVAPRFDRAEATALRILNADIQRVAIGLHLTLTAPFKPASASFRPTRDGAFLPLKPLMAVAFRRGMRHETLVIEIATQLRSFLIAFGRPPDFIDGHQHVHLLPQVRDALLSVAKEAAPEAWVRQCSSAAAIRGRLGDPKGLFLEFLSHGFRRRARARGVRTNPAFSGSYTFTPDADYARLFPTFLNSLPDGGLIMCHPGVVDEELAKLDPLTALREREYAYFCGEEFPRLLAANNMELA